jgi:hypothetical protein
MLADLSVKRAKPREKPYRLTDGGGLYLEIRAKAEVIVTFNEQDFPAVTVDEFDLCTQHSATPLSLPRTAGTGGRCP